MKQPHRPIEMVDYSSYSGSTMPVSNIENENNAAVNKHGFDQNYSYGQGFRVAQQDNSPDTNTPESLSETAMDYHSSMGYMGMMPHYNYNIPRPETYHPMEASFDAIYPSNYPNPTYMPFISSPQQPSLTQMMHPDAPFQVPHTAPFMRMDNQDDSSEIRGRAENWHYAETKQFVQILLAHRQELSDLRRHPGVWETVASELQTCGYDRSVDKCKNRWKVLVAKYKKYTEKTLKNKSPRHPAQLPQMSVHKLPNFMSNMDCHPGLSINYQYYHSHRLANPHGGTGGFEFYNEMHQLLSHIYSHGPDGIIKRRTPQLNHPPQDSILAANNSLVDPNRSFHPFRNENSP
ncbi:hypothetical protein L0F63_001896 [Massospora cicadina]|nr:hypothetical protein L0F63_001896 [Massospora cicadina]